MTKYRVIVVGCVLIVGAAIVANFTALRSFALHLLGTTEFNQSQSEALLVCESPGWLGMVRVLVQDVDLDCGSLWIGRALGQDAIEGWRADWLAEIAHDSERLPRQRFRAAVGGLINNRPVPTSLALLADQANLVTKDWEGLWRTFIDQEINTDWMDPVMMERARLWRHFDQDLVDLEGIYPLAQRWSRSGMGSAEQQAILSAQYWYEVGLGSGRPDGLSEDIATRELWSLPVREPLDRVMQRHQGGCAVVGSDECLVYSLTAWRSVQATRPENWSIPELENDEPAATGELVQLLTIGYEGDASAMNAAALYMTRIAHWATTDTTTASSRLYGLLLRPRRADRVVDPTLAFSDYSNGPWSTALGVSLIVDEDIPVVGVDVEGKFLPQLELPQGWLRLDAGGTGLPVERAQGLSMTREDLYALAAIEKSIELVQERRVQDGISLSGLAERASPIALGASARLALICLDAKVDESRADTASVGAWSHYGKWGSFDEPPDPETLGARQVVRALGMDCGSN